MSANPTEDLAIVRGLLAEFYAPPEIDEWLASPHRLLGGATPNDFIEQGRLYDVLALIDQLQSGAFV